MIESNSDDPDDDDIIHRPLDNTNEFFPRYSDQPDHQQLSTTSTTTSQAATNSDDQNQYRAPPVEIASTPITPITVQRPRQNQGNQDATPAPNTLKSRVRVYLLQTCPQSVTDSVMQVIGLFERIISPISGGLLYLLTMLPFYVTLNQFVTDNIHRIFYAFPLINYVASTFLKEYTNRLLFSYSIVIEIIYAISVSHPTAGTPYLIALPLAHLLVCILDIATFWIVTLLYLLNYLMMDRRSFNVLSTLSQRFVINSALYYIPLFFFSLVCGWIY